MAGFSIVVVVSAGWCACNRFWVARVVLPYLYYLLVANISRHRLANDRWVFPLGIACVDL
jgi:hypothetical protein